MPIFKIRKASANIDWFEVIQRNQTLKARFLAFKLLKFDNTASMAPSIGINQNRVSNKNNLLDILNPNRVFVNRALRELLEINGQISKY